MRRLILGTAGHIDHGKTTLVKALTGVDTDRLPEEKARGITIDLGFAHLQLGELDIGIVDVPGHEALIRNMLAGATGFDAVLLVIAADEGVMPQTREHVAIARLLDVQQLVVALTKADAVEADWLELVRAEVETFVRAELGKTPVIPVSAVTGAGLPELKAALVTQLSEVSRRREADLFRLPIDRVFTVRGTGTVVTGTIWSGRATRQEALQILPASRSVRVRGVQTHGNAVEAAGAGERAAFALAGVDRTEVRRGDVLVGAQGWSAVRTLTARVQLLDGVVLAPRQRVRVHLGTAEMLARAIVLEHPWVQLRLEQPLVARAGDRFVLRSYSPVSTIGGGEVAELDRPRKRLGSAEVESLCSILDGSTEERLRGAIRLAAEQGCAVAELPIIAGVAPGGVAALTTSPPDDLACVADRVYPAAVVERVTQQLRAEVKAHHGQHPLEAGIERAILLGHYDRTIGTHALTLAEKRGWLISRGNLVAAVGFEPGFSPAQQTLRGRLLEELRSAGLAPPTVAELIAAHRSNEVRAVLRLMEAQGDVAAVNPDLYIDRQILADALAKVRTGLGTAALPAGEFKAVLPVSRKYLIPLLEYMDRVGVTKRDGDLRRVQPMEPPETA